jgi:two-component system chemotaxis sensor kinase CheA
MVRNAIDHGIESDPEKRKENGKPEKGRISLRAFHKGGSIFIEIEDDGKGLDPKGILNKAVERGIVNDNDPLSEKEIFSLIFAPGFSTAESITEVSGRGVGMDVVKKNIEALRGQIDIQSELEKGSIFSIKLPLTLAIIDGMVVKICEERYILPTLSIVTSVSVTHDRIETIQNKGEMLSLQDELIPVFRLGKIFELEKNKEKNSAECLVVIIEEDGLKTGIIIDELLGQQQIVIKNLGEFLKDSPGISGGAIMPDGSVGLILDVSGLVKLANSTP